MKKVIHFILMVVCGNYGNKISTFVVYELLLWRAVLNTKYIVYYAEGDLSFGTINNCQINQ